MTTAGDIFKNHGVPVLQSAFGVSAVLHSFRNVRGDLTVTAVAVSPISGERDPAHNGLIHRRERAVMFQIADITPVDAWAEITIDGERWNLQQPPSVVTESTATFLITEFSAAGAERGALHKAGR